MVCFEVHEAWVDGVGSADFEVSELTGAVKYLPFASGKITFEALPVDVTFIVEPGATSGYRNSICRQCPAMRSVVVSAPPSVPSRCRIPSPPIDAPMLPGVSLT
jgi:hypothetical protein